MRKYNKFHKNSMNNQINIIFFDLDHGLAAFFTAAAFQLGLLYFNNLVRRLATAV